MTFFKEHADNFLRSELLKYDYSLRTQYSLSKNGTLIYRALLRQDDCELLGVFSNSGFRVFARQFKIPIDTNSTWDRLYIKTDSTQYALELEASTQINRVINLDTIKASIKESGHYTIPKSLMINPIKYFSELDRERRSYGIIDFSRLKTGEIIEVNFSPTDYLLYFPTDKKLDDIQLEKYWEQRMKKGKRLNDNWFYYKRERPLDNG